MTRTAGRPPRPEVVIPVHDGADRIGATVAAARSIAGVTRVVVVDDGSSDDSWARAVAAGADVVGLERNVGKAGAVRAGVAACPDADVVLLLDADLGDTAIAAAPLLGPVMAGTADMTIGVLPGPGGRGGFGSVRRLAAFGVRRGCGLAVRAPLSGQRAVRRELLDHLGPVERFGLEVALTVDLVRAGARVVEVEIDVDHAHTGRGRAGFAHRGRQGVDVVRALWPRLTSAPLRMALPVVASIAFLLASLALGADTDVGRPLDGQAEKVVVFGVPRLGLGDVKHMPTLDRLARQGAMAATNVRTGGDIPRPWAAYATISAGVRVDAVAEAAGSEPSSGGGVRVPAMAATRDAAGRFTTSRPGALGRALGRAGLRTAVISPGEDRPDAEGPLIGPSDERHGRTTGAALVVADDGGAVDVGEIEPRAGAPSGPGGGLGPSVAAALRGADVVVVDPGLTLPVAPTRPGALDRPPSDGALRAVDRELTAIVRVLPSDTLLLVVGVTPPTSEWALTPTVAWGAGVTEHRLASPTVRRPDLVTLTDIGPTVLEAFEIERPSGMTGQALRQRAGTLDRDRLERLDELARGREATYFRMTITFIALQALLHLVTWVLLLAGRMRPGAAATVRFLTLVGAAWPLSTYLVRVVPELMSLGPVTHLAPWPVAAAVAAAASRLRRHPLAPLTAVAAATAAVIVVDLATGAHLQIASILGTAPHTTYRFNGLGNVGFAVLSSAAVIAVAVHVDAAARRREALVTAACALGVVTAADVAPWMGADVGGMLTLVPSFGLTLVALSGRRIRFRSLLVAAAVAVVGLAVVTGLDLLRPPEARTHLARFLTETVADGDLGATVGRRWAANTRMFTQSAWTWAVPPLAAGFTWAIARSGRLRRLAPMARGTRVGVLAALAVGVVGWLLNDSGVVVTALVLVYVPAVLTVVAMARVTGEPEPVPPASPLQPRPESS